MSLSRIIKKNSEEKMFEEYHATVTNQARIAFESITNANNLSEITSVLSNFFKHIK